MNRLDKLESDSIYIIREAYAKFSTPAVMYSGGKDSTVLIWLVRAAFLGSVPFPIVHIDTGCHIPSLIEWRDSIVREMELDLVVARSSHEHTDFTSKLDCCNELKTNALKSCIAEHNYDALLLGIRSDEHGVRSKERVWSPRDGNFTWDYMNQPPEVWGQYSSASEHHIRVHPLLSWTELDVWRYIQRYDIPVIDLYYSKGGRRYRSIGCAPCCGAIESSAATIDDIIYELEVTRVSERSGRAQDKESWHQMQRLRSLGYC